MLKKVIKDAIGKMGYEIGRIAPVSENSDRKYFKRSENDADYFETPIGNYYLPNNAPEDVVINAMKNGVYFDQNIIDIAQQYIKPGTAILDVGANFGQMSVYFSKLTGGSGEVYSFDADDYIFEFLKKNIEANDCKNIVPVFGAVYNVSEKIFTFPKQDFKKFGAYGSYGLDLKAEEGRKVKSIKIDDLGIQKPISFMKIDVQGSDLFAMQGAEQTIREHKMPIIFEFEQQFQKDFNTTFQDYVDFVDRISYRFETIVDDINYLVVPR